MIDRWVARSGTGAALVAALLACPAPARAQADQAADPLILLVEARRYFDALDYEHALPPLDRAIVIIEAKPAGDAARRRLPDAYEMRARSRFGLEDQTGALNDFVALLKVDPGYALTGDVSPRVLELFEAARNATVTTLKLEVTPSTAEVRVDDKVVPASSTMPILAGTHVVSAKQLGYRAVTQPVEAVAGTAADVSIALERVSSVLSLVTSPPGVEVLIDGVTRGETAGGPPPAEWVQRAAGQGIAAPELSSIMVIPELASGPHVLEFRRGCHVPSERRVTIDKPDDYSVDPIRLQRAIATLKVTSNQPSTRVLIDGQPRGGAPLSIPDLCEGAHTIELRSPTGRFFRRIDSHTGDTIDVAGTLKPAFALVSSSGQAALNADPRLAAERVFEPLQSVTLFAPAAERLDPALKAEQLPAAWLAFNNKRQALGVTADLSLPMRKDLSAKLARAFDAQGVASVTVPSSLDRNTIVLSLLAAGSGEPDVLELSLDDNASIASALARLERTVSFFRPSIGVTAIDVADVTGAAVVGVDADGPAAKAGVQPGDIVVKVNDQAIADATSLGALLEGRKANEAFALELKDRAGASKRADVKVVMTPRLVGIADQTLLVNRTLLDLRVQVQVPSEPVEEAVRRLNLAAALVRLENWSEAQTELRRVKLPDGPRVANGTVQYLLGLCADKLGNRSEAEAAWRAAAATDSLLTEDGPPVRELADARLGELQRGGVGAR